MCGYDSQRRLRPGEGGEGVGERYAGHHVATHREDGLWFRHGSPPPARLAETPAPPRIG